VNTDSELKMGRAEHEKPPMEASRKQPGGLPMTPQEFVDKWRRSKLGERPAAQSHFNDLCRMLGHPTPAKADPEGASAKPS
jgi:hypothetical protein